MGKNMRGPASLLLAAAVIAGCQDQRITTPEAGALPEEATLARVLQAGEFEEPCGTVLTLALRSEAGEPVGQVTVWNGPTRAYVRLTAQAGWEFTEVRVGGALQPEQFPRSGGVVSPRRFQFGGRVRPPQPEVVIEALHLGNPFDVQPGDEVLLAVFAQLQPVEGGAQISAWAEGTPFQPGEHPMYFRYTLQECPVLEPSTITAGSFHTCGLTTDGRAYCWGNNEDGSLGDGTTTTRLTPTAVVGDLTFAELSAEGGHTCGLTADGRAYCWGLNEDGRLGDGTTTTRLVPAPVVGWADLARLPPMRW